MMRNEGLARGRCALAVIALAAFSASARAQDAPPPATVQGLDTFSPPPSRPTPTPIPSPTPVVPVVIVPVPTPSATPAPVATPAARPSPRATTPAPAPAATISAVPEPATPPDVTPPEATPTPGAVQPSPAATPSATTPPGDRSDGFPVWAIALGVLALAALGALLVLRRRRTNDAGPVREAPFIPPAPAEPAPAPAASAPTTPAPRFLEPAPAPPPERAWIDLSVTARRAGVNLLTATADVEIALHNSGPAVAQVIRLDVRLLSARAGQDDELGALFAVPVDRPTTPPFDLGPGETRTIRTLATLPRDAINVLTAADRPMFVPVLAVNARYAGGEDVSGQTAAAYAIGIERDGAAKLAPFWLDGPTRMYDAVAVRPHALALKT